MGIVFWCSLVSCCVLVGSLFWCVGCYSWLVVGWLFGWLDLVVFVFMRGVAFVACGVGCEFLVRGFFCLVIGFAVVRVFNLALLVGVVLWLLIAVALLACWLWV